MFDNNYIPSHTCMMAPKLSIRTSFYIFVVVSFVSNSLLGIEKQKKLRKITVLTLNPQSHVRVLIYQTCCSIFSFEIVCQLRETN